MKKKYQSAQRKRAMKISFLQFGCALSMLLLSPALLAANLQHLDVASLPGDRVEIKLSFDEPVAAPRGYTIEQPARIALDLPGVANKLGSKSRELGMGNARSVTVVEAKDRTRLIINLTSLSSYNTRVEGNELFVVVGDGAAVRKTSAVQVGNPVVSSKLLLFRGGLFATLIFSGGSRVKVI